VISAFINEIRSIEMIEICRKEYLLAIILYLTPASLISAELSTEWPQIRGVYVWVKEALGQQ
jgi:hypothetical protein